MSKLGTTVCITAVLSVLTIGSASAQEKGSARLEEVIVTAQKREASVQDVPVSVFAIGEEQIIKAGIQSFEDYARGIAGLSFTEAGRFSRGGNVPQIRGIAQIGIHPVNAFVLDETPLQPQEFERVGIPDPNLFDIDRIEILRGPQGDVYGSSAMGGIIKVVTNKPDPAQFASTVAASVSTVDDGGENYEVSGMLNLPLVEDRSALRLVVQRTHEGGFIDLVPDEVVNQFGSDPNFSLLDGAQFQFDDDANKVDVTQFRAALRWQISDRLTVTPSIFYQTVEEDRGRFVGTNLSTETGRYLDVDYDNDEFADNDFTLSNLLVEYDLGIGQVISSTTYFDLDWSNSLSAQGIGCNFFGTCGDPTAFLRDVGEETQIAQEFRFASDLDGSFNFIVGVFYRDVEDTFAQLSTAEALVPVVGTNLIFQKSGEVEEIEERAVFGQATWEPVESLELALGARWFEYERHNFTPETSGLFGFPTRDTRAEEDGVLPTASLRYSFNDDAMTYARAAEGFRPGFGFATIFPPPCASELERLGIDPDSGVGQVDADSVWTYELGTKTAWLDNRLIVNATAYHTDWDDIHARIGLNCGFGLDRNAGTAEVDGAELEMRAIVGDGLDLSLAIGYTDASFTESVPAIGAFDGDPLPQVPEWTYGAVAQYSFPVMAGIGYIRADYSYTDKSRLLIASTNPLDALEKPSLGLLGLRFGVDYPQWQVAIFAKNVTDERELDLCAREITFRNARPETSTCGTTPREIGLYVSRSFE